MKLGPGEHVIVRTRPHPRALLLPFIGALVVLAASGFGLGLLSRDGLPSAILGWVPLLVVLVLAVAVLILLRIFLRPMMRWWGMRYILTSRRFIKRHGFSTRREHELALASIYQLDTSQTLLQRSTGSGTLTVDLGRDRTVVYPDVPQVHTFKEFMVEAIGDLPLTVMFDGVDMEADPVRDHGQEESR
ncbi:PH domain-containing protein [Arthrobacter sp. CAN_A1]|uniref:PH domain-containing protein n=1 Tax=Arthrobacter sp. CAN_A1 TaxID=2787717 RepID=UPI0018C91E3A